MSALEMVLKVIPLEGYRVKVSSKGRCVEGKMELVSRMSHPQTPFTFEVGETSFTIDDTTSDLSVTLQAEDYIGKKVVCEDINGTPFHGVLYRVERLVYSGIDGLPIMYTVKIDDLVLHYIQNIEVDEEISEGGIEQ